MSRAPNAPTRTAELDAAAIAAADALALVAIDAHCRGRSALHDAAAFALDTIPRNAGTPRRTQHLEPAVTAVALCEGCPVLAECYAWVSVEPWFSGVAAGHMYVNGAVVHVARRTPDRASA